MAIQRFSKLLYTAVRSSARSKVCSKGVFVFMEGAPYHGPWILHKGVVALVKSSSSGKEYMVRQVEPGEIFAEVPLFKNVAWYPVNARCLSRCELSLLPTENVKRAIQTDPEMAWLAACSLSQRITDYRDIIFDLTLADVQQRLLHYLLRRLEGKPNSSLGVVRLGVNHQDLALLLGIRPESLSRALSELEKTGKLKRLSRHSYQIFTKKITKEDREI